MFFLRKPCRVQYKPNTFLICHKQDLGRWNRLGSRWEAGDSRTGIVSPAGSRGTKKAPAPCWEADRVCREPFADTCLGWHLPREQAAAVCASLNEVMPLTTDTKRSTLTLSYRGKVLAAEGLWRLWCESWRLWFTYLGSNPAHVCKAPWLLHTSMARAVHPVTIGVSCTVTCI